MAKQKYWFYHGQMRDTGQSIFYYDNFFGPPVRQDFEDGKAVTTEFATESQRPSEMSDLVSLTEWHARERRLF